MPVCLPASLAIGLVLSACQFEHSADSLLGSALTLPGSALTVFAVAEHLSWEEKYWQVRRHPRVPEGVETAR